MQTQTEQRASAKNTVRIPESARSDRQRRQFDCDALRQGRQPHDGDRRGAHVRSAQRRVESLPVKHPNAAGIDLGSKEHYVAVPEGRDDKSVQSFDCYTDDLRRLSPIRGAEGLRLPSLRPGPSAGRAERESVPLRPSPSVPSANTSGKQNGTQRRSAPAIANPWSGRPSPSVPSARIFGGQNGTLRRAAPAIADPWSGRPSPAFSAAWLLKIRSGQRTVPQMSHSVPGRGRAQPRIPGGCAWAAKGSAAS